MPHLPLRPISPRPTASSPVASSPSLGVSSHGPLPLVPSLSPQTLRSSPLSGPVRLAASSPRSSPRGPVRLAAGSPRSSHRSRVRSRAEFALSSPRGSAANALLPLPPARSMARSPRVWSPASGWLRCGTHTPWSAPSRWIEGEATVAEEWVGNRDGARVKVGGGDESGRHEEF